MEESKREEQDTTSSFEDVKERLASLNESMKNHLSFEDVRVPSSTASYSTSMEFEIPDRNEFFPSSLEELSYGGQGNVYDFNGEDDKENEFTKNIETDKSSGLWKYPYGSPTSPGVDSFRPLSEESSNSPSPARFNTSPQSSSTISSSPLSDRFLVVDVVGQQRVVDMELVDPYLKVLTHGGHHVVNGERHVIVVFNACYLPKRNIPKYHVVMEQLFYYCVHAVDLLVTDSYEIVFFNSGMNSNNIPPRHMIKQCYEMIQHRLRKNLKNIFFVHPSLLLRTVIRFTRFFVSSKFRRKMIFVKNVKTLKSYLPVEYIFITPELQQIENKFR